MSLDFSGGATHRLDIGSAAGLDNVSQGNLLVWVWPLTTSPSVHGGIYTKNGSTGTLIQQRTTGAPRMMIDGAVDTIVLPNAAGTFAALKWCFLCFQWDLAGAASAQKIFHGDLTTPAAEYGYTTQQVGNTFTDDSGGNGVYGNDIGGANNFNGYIAYASLVTGRLLSLAEIEAWRLKPGKLLGAIDYRDFKSTAAADLRDTLGNNAATLTGGATQAHPVIGVASPDMRGTRLQNVADRRLRAATIALPLGNWWEPLFASGATPGVGVKKHDIRTSSAYKFAIQQSRRRDYTGQQASTFWRPNLIPSGGGGGVNNPATPPARKRRNVSRLRRLRKRR